MNTLNKELFAGVTILHALVAAVVLLAIAPMVSKFLQSKSEPPLSKHRAMSSCPSCGWSGSVSRHSPKCPKCSAPLVA